jgi:hypothetical protein
VRPLFRLCIHKSIMSHSIQERHKSRPTDIDVMGQHATWVAFEGGPDFFGAECCCRSAGSRWGQILFSFASASFVPKPGRIQPKAAS